MISTVSEAAADPAPNEKETLDPLNPASWGSLASEALFGFSKSGVEAAQLQALRHRFETLRPQIVALDQLATRQGVDQLESIADIVPALFDNRVYKSYPVTLIEQRKFDRLTKWIQRLTTCDLSGVDVEGIDSVDAWLERLGDVGMSVGHTTGTTGKLSFVPHSEQDWAGYSAAIYEMQRGMFGFDPRGIALPYFTPAYRRAHYAVGAKLQARLAADRPETERFFAHPHEISVDLISMAARLQDADASGQLDKLKFESKLLSQREALIAQSANRDAELQEWLRKLAEDFRGREVFIQGTGADLIRAMQRGQELGIKVDVAPESILMTGGGMKGYEGASADWEADVCAFFGVGRINSTYGMTESLGAAGRCEHKFYHFAPYLMPIMLDEDYEALPRQGVQTGRFAFFDFLAETEWGGYITDDQLTMHWDGACACGRQGPRADRNIARISDVAGGDDDKISCAGVTEAYDSFMDFVSTI
jgi:hypothetical protein